MGGTAGARLSRWLAWAALPLASSAMAQVAVLDCGASAAQPMVVRYFDDDAAAKGAHGQAVAFKPLGEQRKALSCRKPQGAFVFEFKAVPVSPTVQGLCAGNVTGELTVTHKGRQVLPPTTFEDPAGCFDTRAESQRVRSITLDAKGGKPVIDRSAAR